MIKDNHHLQLFHEDLINKSPIKQIDIAKELGYDSPNLITMFKQGKTRVPIDKVPLLANIFNIDPKKMLLRYLCEYQPFLLKIIDQYFGAIITKNEQDIINEIRRLSKGKDPGDYFNQIKAGYRELCSRNKSRFINPLK